MRSATRAELLTRASHNLSVAAVEVSHLRDMNSANAVMSASDHSILTSSQRSTISTVEFHSDGQEFMADGYDGDVMADSMLAVEAAARLPVLLIEQRRRSLCRLLCLPSDVPRHSATFSTSSAFFAGMALPVATFLRLGHLLASAAQQPTSTGWGPAARFRGARGALEPGSGAFACSATAIAAAARGGCGASQGEGRERGLVCAARGSANTGARRCGAAALRRCRDSAAADLGGLLPPLQQELELVIVHRAARDRAVARRTPGKRQMPAKFIKGNRVKLANAENCVPENSFFRGLFPS